MARATGRFLVIGESEAQSSAPIKREAPSLGQVTPEEAMGMSDVSHRAALGPVELLVRPPAWLGNHDGIMHGGIQVALSAAAFRFAAVRNGGSGVGLLDATISYLRPVLVQGDAIRLTAEVVKSGRLISLVHCMARDQRGRELFSGQATFGQPVS